MYFCELWIHTCVIIAYHCLVSWISAVFDSCFSTEVLPDGMYQIYLHEIITELHEEFPGSSFLAFNFREGEKRSQFAEILCKYDVTVMDYPRQYEGCPLLPLSLIQHFLRVCESWLSLGNQQNIILLHCERGGWPLLAFLLASFLIFQKLHSGERRTLEIVHREAPKGFLQLLSPLNPFPSQLRYLQYVARRNLAPEWPPPERALSLDCVILRAIPSFDSQNGCRPIIRIFGRNLLSKGGLSTQMLFSMDKKKKKTLRHYCQVRGLLFCTFFSFLFFFFWVLNVLVLGLFLSVLSCINWCQYDGSLIAGRLWCD